MVKTSRKFGSMLLWAMAFSVLCFSGCGRRDAASITEQAATAATTEPAIPATVETAPTEPEATVQEKPELTGEYDRDKVALALRPTGRGGGWYYYIPANQEAWVEAWNSAIAKADPDRIDNKRSGRGIWVSYQDEMLELLADGSILDWGNGQIAAGDCAGLYTLALDTYRELGMKDPVRPNQISGICSATLELDGTHTITDPEKLGKIEAWLSGSEEYYGGSSCPLTALLTLKLESGEEMTISMATDSCSIWLTEGVFYQYPSPDNLAFYSLFGVEDFFA